MHILIKLLSINMTIRSTRVYKIKQLILYACKDIHLFCISLFFVKEGKIEKEKIENMIYEIRGVI